MECESGHLREIAHRGFAAVGLPVRIRNKADSRVEAEIWRDGSKPLRIPGKDLLQPQDAIQHDAAHRSKDKQGGAVSRPLHF